MTLPTSSRRLGRTDIQVTPVSIGCAEIGSMPDVFGYSVPRSRALATIRAALSAPVRLLDTASAYGDGASEALIGEVLRELGGLPPDRVVATKVGRNRQTGEFTGAAMLRYVERSASLLGLPTLPLLYLHSPEYLTWASALAKDGPIETLVGVRERGLARHLGVAGGSPEVLERYLQLGIFDVVLCHNRYTLLDRSASSLMDTAVARGIGMVNAAPYGGGFLARGPHADSRYAYAPAGSELLRAALAMERACHSRGISLAAAALQFSVRDPRVDTTVVGMSHPSRVRETDALLSTNIPPDLWQILDELAPVSDGKR